MSASPGPWKWELGDDSVDRLIDADGRDVVTGWFGSHRGFVSCSEDDGNLIALAPEMAEMLRSLEWVGRHCPACGFMERDTVFSEADHRTSCRLAALLARLP